MPNIEWIELKENECIPRNTPLLVSNGVKALVFYNGFTQSDFGQTLKF